MNKWDYSKGLPNIKKHRQIQEFEIMDDEKLYTTNIDGFPYLLEDETIKYFKVGNKIAIDSEIGLYTVKSVDEENYHVELKLDKILDITSRTVDMVAEHYIGWGMKPEAEKVKCNYLWTYQSSFVDVKLNIEGKLSKNQVVQFNNDIIKITELVKNEEKQFVIVGEHVKYDTVTPLFPYIKNGEIKCFYDDIGDVYLKQARDTLSNY